MAVNTIPVAPKTPRFLKTIVTAANVRSDGVGTIGTDIYLLGTTGADGSIVRSVRFIPTSTTANAAIAATVLRIYLSTVSSGATTAANTFLVGEIVFPVQTASSSTTATIPIDFVLDRPLPTGVSVLLSTHVVTNANTFIVATSIFSDY